MTTHGRATLTGRLTLVLAACSSCAADEGGGTGSGSGRDGGSDSGRAGDGGGEAGSGGGPSSAGGARGGGTSAGGAGGTGSAGAPPSTGGTGAGGNAEGGAAPDGGPTAPGPRALPCALPGNPSGTDPLPAPGEREATVIRRNFGFIEGPVWVAATGTLLFSDMNFGGGNVVGPPAQIRSLVPSPGSDAFDVFVAESGSNGLGLANDGRVLAATHDVQSLSYFDAVTGAREDWPLRVDGLRFNSPNDLVVRSDGNVYFTDPSWQLGSRTSETGVEGFYRVSPAGAVTRIAITPTRPNGVTLSPDESTLYVGGQSGGIYAVPLDAGGAPGTPVRFADGSTDGMTVDCAGNVYMTRDDVVVFAPSGTELGRISLDRSPSNVAFGGDDARTLFITGGDTLFRIRLNLPGMPY